ncbi:eIF2 kinase Gcn2p negative regulator [Serendipita sp. 396]|nr:eIF2 kinase Gcn2p negative regulator [Serendipita sp. 396]KAG8786922.1 eIF2 kinase Gcn2p negative regulator [Serendipita sp. 397]KAG8802418.1 eIF2 kinase Gcn2p negative regulator [Serendipita sp. 398]KAG8822241.1 eIF2 kinase Gcn2p negative regulator [Serendipita sp. 400]KAG8858070.1 eIF2 kinase Gcn2p negative regulator [Serendipita sp. 411]KAG8871636.1 eIF2 kinase Gcn2p negative regulator [Serendipita sp. 405]
MTANTIDQLTEELERDPDREQIAQEIQALQSIYSGDDAVRIWKPEHDSSARLPKDTIRLDVRTALSPPHEEVLFRLLVSLPATYPASSPPQLQILSRYIGSFQVDSTLFGAALKTYISSGRVRFMPGEVAIFDGVENLREVIQQWYEDRLNATAAADLQREDERAHAHAQAVATQEEEIPSQIQAMHSSLSAAPSELPDGLQIWVSDPVVDRKSTFIGRACRITHPTQVPLILSYLMEDRSTAKATHPVINAWRCEVDEVLYQDNDDDGETAAGGRLAHLLQILELKNVLVVVTRWFGGIHLQGDRFRHINAVARAALDTGGFLDVPEETRRKGRTGAKGKTKP